MKKIMRTMGIFITIVKVSAGTIGNDQDPYLSNNIVESVTTAVKQPWCARYELEENSSPSTVVINALRTQITNFF